MSGSVTEMSEILEISMQNHDKQPESGLALELTAVLTTVLDYAPVPRT